MITNLDNIGGGGGGGYVLPVASQQTLGGVKVGSGLTINESGVLSTSGGTGGDEARVLKRRNNFPENPNNGDVVSKTVFKSGWSVNQGESAVALWYHVPSDYSYQRGGTITAESGYTFQILGNTENEFYQVTRYSGETELDYFVLSSGNTDVTTTCDEGGDEIRFHFDTIDSIAVDAQKGEPEEGVFLTLDFTYPNIEADNIYQYDGHNWVPKQVKSDLDNLDYYDFTNYESMSEAEKKAWFEFFYSRYAQGDYSFGIYLDRTWHDDERNRKGGNIVRMPFQGCDTGYFSLAFGDAQPGGDNVVSCWFRLNAYGGTEYSEVGISTFNPSGSQLEVDDNFAKIGGDLYMFIQGVSQDVAPGSYWSLSYFPVFHRYGQGDDEREFGTILWGQRLNSTDAWIQEHGGYGVIAEFIIPLSGVPYRVKVKACRNDEGTELWTVVSSTQF